ncbi:hypothetical protein [Candidatus Cytomitobacter primus]|uniref:Uncharacterized protein n=1 Tax=Candidatus Cytomitobacter primus TaxID=2066024 RepID=A0A5C0UFV6_9PROT|nr:hypothetical protein [Candidatus Cytomitobacter primus]QEK38561.1 hypothetical protein FZC34_01390 [Candidatus Cytomitobacter primus]
MHCNNKILPFMVICILKVNSAVSAEDLEKIQICTNLIENSTPCLQGWVGLDSHKLINLNGVVFDGLSSHLQKQKGIVAYRLRCIRNEKDIDRVFSYNYSKGVIHEFDIDPIRHLNTIQDGENHHVLNINVSNQQLIEKPIHGDLNNDEFTYLQDVVKFFQIIKSLAMQYKVLDDSGLKNAFSTEDRRKDIMDFICHEAKIDESINNSMSSILNHYNQEENKREILEGVTNVNQQNEAIKLSIKELSDKIGEISVDKMGEIFGDLAEILTKIQNNKSLNDEILSALEKCCGEIKGFFTDGIEGQNMLKNMLEILEGNDNDKIMQDHIKAALVAFFIPNGGDTIDFQAILNQILREVSNINDPKLLKGLVSETLKRVNELHNKADATQTKVNTISIKVDDTNTVAKVVNGKIAQTNTKLDTVSGKTDKINEKVTFISQAVRAGGPFDIAIKDISSKVNNIDTQMNPDPYSSQNQIKTFREILEYVQDQLNKEKDDTLANQVDCIKKILEIDGDIGSKMSLILQALQPNGDINANINQIKMDLQSDGALMGVANSINYKAGKILKEAEEIDRHVDSAFNKNKSGSIANEVRWIKGEMSRPTGALKLRELIVDIRDRMIYGNDALSAYAIGESKKNNINFTFTAYTVEHLKKLGTNYIEPEYAMKIIKHIIMLSNCKIDKINNDALDAIMHINSYVSNANHQKLAYDYFSYIREIYGSQPIYSDQLFRIIAPVIISSDLINNVNNGFIYIENIWDNYSESILEAFNTQNNQISIKNLTTHHKTQLVCELINRALKLHDQENNPPISQKAFITELAIQLVVGLEMYENIESNQNQYLRALITRNIDIDTNIIARYVNLPENKPNIAGYTTIKDYNLLKNICITLYYNNSINDIREVVEIYVNKFNSLVNANNSQDLNKQVVDLFIKYGAVSYDDSLKKYLAVSTFDLNEISSSVTDLNSLSMKLGWLDYMLIDETKSEMLNNIVSFLFTQYISSIQNENPSQQISSSQLDQQINLLQFIVRFSRSVMKKYDQYDPLTQNAFLKYAMNGNDLLNNNENFLFALINSIDALERSFRNNTSISEDKKIGHIDYIMNAYFEYFELFLCNTKKQIDQMNRVNISDEMFNAYKQKLALILMNYFSIYIFTTLSDGEGLGLNITDNFKIHMISKLLHNSNKIVSTLSEFVQYIQNPALLNAAFQFINEKRSFGEGGYGPETSNGTDILLNQHGTLEYFAQLLNHIYDEKVVDPGLWTV